jgi:hypothetical protein
MKAGHHEGSATKTESASVSANVIEMAEDVEGRAVAG